MKNHEDKPIIFYCEAMRDLALEVARLKNLETGEIEWKYFDDGWPNFRIEEVEKIRRRDIVFFAGFTGPADVFSQLAVLYQFREKKADSLHIILPYFPVGTMDRADKAGEIVTAQALAQMLSAIPVYRSKGNHLLSVFDIHAVQEEGYFGNGNVIFDAQSAISLLLREIEKMIYMEPGCAEHIRAERRRNIAVALPDEGAVKRFGKKLPDWLCVIKCDKIKTGKNGKDKKVIIKEGDSKGKHVIILDDLVNSGETIIQCRHELKHDGAEYVSAFAPHGVFPKKAWRRITPELFENFWITDSCSQTAKAIKGKNPFRVLSLAQPIAEIID